MLAKTKVKEEITLCIRGIPVTVKRKRIKHLYLRVRAASAQVEVSAPVAYDLNAIEDWLQQRYEWLVKQRQTRAEQVVEPEHEYVTGEQHWFWGDAYTLVVSTTKRGTNAFIKGDELHLVVLPHYTADQRQRVLHRWYRDQLTGKIDALLSIWQPRMGVYTSGFGTKLMKTRWGSCNIRTRKIWLNLALVKKTQTCVEYVLVHELTHLFERYHNARFYRLMDEFLPDWRERKQHTNRII